MPRKETRWRPATGKHEEPQGGKTLHTKEGGSSDLDDLGALILLPKTSVPDHEAVTVLFVQPVLTWQKTLPVALSDTLGLAMHSLVPLFFARVASAIASTLDGMKITTVTQAMASQDQRWKDTMALIPMTQL